MNTKRQAVVVDGVECHTCSACNTLKPLGEFYRRQGRPLGICSNCKKCESKGKCTPEYRKRDRELYWKNPQRRETRRKRDAERRRANPTEGIQRRRDSYQANLEAERKKRKDRRNKPKPPGVAARYSRAHRERYKLVETGEITKPSRCEVCGETEDLTTGHTSIVTCYDSFELDRIWALPWICLVCRNQFTADRMRLAAGQAPHGVNPQSHGSRK